MKRRIVVETAQRARQIGAVEIDDPAALRRRVEFDLHYIETWSIWLDLRILLLTPFRLVDGRNAF